MFENDIRWSALVPLSLALGLAVLAVEASGVWGALPFRPEWFGCLAFYAGLRAAPFPSLCAFAWCGLVRDGLLGDKMGSATIAFILIGWLGMHWKVLAAVRGALFQMAALGVCAFGMAALRRFLDAGGLWTRMLPASLLAALGDAVLSAFAYLPCVLLLSLPSLRPWRARNGFF